ncbi:secreted protein [Melampsora americana]|nr:secreted protein [Melampsora americana]
MQITILSCMVLMLKSHVLGLPALGEIVRGSETAKELQAAGEISNIATHGRPALQSEAALHPITSTARDGTPELGSLFGGRTAQGSTSKDASTVHSSSGFVTDKNPTDIFINKPAPPYVPPTFKDPVTGKTLPTILNPDQIEKLQPEQLLEYISNFDPAVRAARDTLRAADLQVEKAETELFKDAISAYKAKTEPKKTLGQLFKEHDEAKIPESAQKIIQKIKTDLKTVAPLGTTDEQLNKLAMKQFARTQRVSFKNLNLDIGTAEEARHKALELAHLRKASGYPAAKIESSVKRFLPKIDFQFPWKKPTIRNPLSASLTRRIRYQLARFQHSL